MANLVSQISERELSWGHLKLVLYLLLLYFFRASSDWLQNFLLHLAESCTCFPTSTWKLRSSQIRLFPDRFLSLRMLTRALYPLSLYWPMADSQDCFSTILFTLLPLCCLEPKRFCFPHSCAEHHIINLKCWQLFLPIWTYAHWIVHILQHHLRASLDS